MEIIIKPIKDYDGYFISNEGVVYCNLGRGNRRDKDKTTVPLYLIKPRIAKNGYLRIYARNTKTNKRMDLYIHRLVATYFIDNPYHYNIVNHKDCNRTNNKVSNLEWCTAKQNNEQTFKLKHMLRNKQGQFVGNYDYRQK